MKKLFYPVFKVVVNGQIGILDFENEFGDGRFITEFVEDGLELEGIRKANAWVKEFTNAINNRTDTYLKMEQRLLDFAKKNNPNISFESLEIIEVSHYYSDKVYCYWCQTWYYEDDSCEC